MSTRFPLNKVDLKNRNIPTPINRGHKAEYYEEDGQVFCRRWDRYITQTMVLKLGPSPYDGRVCVYWDTVSSMPNEVS